MDGLTMKLEVLYEGCMNCSLSHSSLP
jgi:hypothetical protein